MTAMSAATASTVKSTTAAVHAAAAGLQGLATGAASASHRCAASSSRAVHLCSPSLSRASAVGTCRSSGHDRLQSAGDGLLLHDTLGALDRHRRLHHSPRRHRQVPAAGREDRHHHHAAAGAAAAGRHRRLTMAGDGRDGGLSGGKVMGARGRERGAIRAASAVSSPRREERTGDSVGGAAEGSCEFDSWRGRQDVVGMAREESIVTLAPRMADQHQLNLDNRAESSGATLPAYPTCPRWRRVMLKVSGEALAGEGSGNIDPKITMSIAREVAAITRLGIEVAMVVGGGNFFRGAHWAGASGLDRASADQIGMIATVMNALFLQASLESLGVPTRVQTAFKMADVAEPYIRRRALRHLEKGRVVIFGAGTGNPFFTTDTAAALRAAEINAEVLLKATNVDGVYDSDPKKNPMAKLHHHVSYRDVAIQGLSVMDITAVTLCQENHIPVVVFNLNKQGNITKALSGEQIGTMIHDDSHEVE